MTAALWEGLTGGALIGASAATLLLFNGDILGASGLARSVFLTPLTTLKDASQHWKLVLMASFLSMNYTTSTTAVMGAAAAPALSSAAYGLAGVLVGWGTTMGNGCTSGHGICGLARLSRRSMVAVGTFMSTAVAATVFAYYTPALQRYTAFLLHSDSSDNNNDSRDNDKWNHVALGLTLATTLMALVAPWFHARNQPRSINNVRKLAPAAAAGALFALGLKQSQMMYPSRVFAFLNVTAMKDGSWDPTLCCVMLSGVLVSFASYQWVAGHRLLKNTHPLEHPLALSKGSSFCVPSNTQIDAQLLLGSAAFGMGWGLAGICPGPALIQAGLGNAALLQHWWPAFLAGSFVAQRIKKAWA
jgi:uncharacterized protein